MADLMTLAACGDREAQAELVSQLINGAPDGLPYADRLMSAEVFARLAALHGHADDRLCLAGVLMLRSAHLRQIGNVEGGQVHFEEAVRLVDELVAEGVNDGTVILAVAMTRIADSGDEGAAVRLNSLMERLSPNNAAELRNQVKQALQEIAEHEEQE